MMLARLDEELTVDAEEGEGGEEVMLEVLDKYMRDMAQMMQGMLDLQRR